MGTSPRSGRGLRTRAIALFAVVTIAAVVFAGCSAGSGHPDAFGSSQSATPAPVASGCGSMSPLAFAGGLPLIACATEGTWPPLRPRRASTSIVTTPDNLRLEISTPSSTYRAGQVIDVQATLVFLGPGEKLVVGASGSGLVAFRVRQLDGNLEAGGVATADCRTYDLERDAVQQIPFAKSGGFVGDGSANSEFVKTYLSNSALSLPSGTWEIVAVLGYSSGGCTVAGGAVFASVFVFVE